MPATDDTVSVFSRIKQPLYKWLGLYIEQSAGFSELYFLLFSKSVVSAVLRNQYCQTTIS